MEYKLKQKKQNTIKPKKQIEEDIEELEEYIYNELENITPGVDLGVVTSRIMYKILLFHIQDYSLNNEIVRREANKYFQMNNSEFLNNIP